MYNISITLIHVENLCRELVIRTTGDFMYVDIHMTNLTFSRLGQYFFEPENTEN